MRVVTLLFGGITQAPGAIRFTASKRASRPFAGSHATNEPTLDFKLT
jgi:hypothetical protein